MKNYLKVSLLFCLFAIQQGCISIGDSKKAPEMPSATAEIREIPTPFFSIDLSKQFLFIDILGNDLCPDSCGACVASEAVAPYFEFKDGNLLLYDYSNKYGEQGFYGANTWEEYRSQTNLTGLSYIQVEWSFNYWTELEGYPFTPITELPFKALSDLFTIQQVDRFGNVHILFDDKFVEVGPNESVTVSVWKQDESQTSPCLVEHKYTMTNHGFIQDKDVILVKP